MKATKILLLVVLFIGQVTFASNTKPTREDSQKITKRVSSLLENPSFDIEDEIKVSVKLIVNSKNEVVVLDILTDNVDAEEFIKSRLNYSSIEGTLIGEQFIIPVRLIPGV